MRGLHRTRFLPLLLALVTATSIATGVPAPAAAAATARPAPSHSGSDMPVRTGHAHIDFDDSNGPPPPGITPGDMPQPLAAPSRPAPRTAARTAGSPTREVFGFAQSGEVLGNGWQSDIHMDQISTLAYFGVNLNGDGSIANTTGYTAWNSVSATNMISAAHAAGDRVVVVAKAFDAATIADIVGSDSNRRNAVASIINLITSRNADGVNIDFEGAGHAVAPGLVTFASELQAGLRAQIPSHSYFTMDTYGASAMFPGQTMFDINGLAPSVDAFMVMAYDLGFSNGSTPTLPNAPLAGPYTYTDESIMQSYTSVVPSWQVILGVPYYGYKFSTTGTAFNAPENTGAAGGGCAVECADSYSSILSDFACAPQLVYQRDAPSSTPWATWYSPATNDPCGGNHNSDRELYYDDYASLGTKYEYVKNTDLRGIGIWSLGYDSGSQDLWNAIRDHFSVSHATGCTAPGAIPNAPTSAQATGEDSSAWITWMPPVTACGGYITGYTVTVSQGGSAIGLRTTTGDTGVSVAPLTNGVTYTFTVSATDSGGTGAPSAPVAATPVARSSPGEVTAITPWRTLDTRSGSASLNQGHPGPLGAGQAMTVHVADGAHVPANATAVILNVTAADATTWSYVTAYPTGAPRPLASNLNIGPGQIIAAAAQIGVGPGGNITLFNAAGNTDLIVDVSGYVTPGPATAGSPGLFEPLSPYRVCDSRAGAPKNECNATGATTMTAGSVKRIAVGGTSGSGSGVPATGGRAVVLNVTATGTTSGGYLTVFADTGSPSPTPPLASTLNWSTGQTVANRVVVALPASGIVDIYNAAGSTDVVVDVNGWYTNGTVPSQSGAAFTPLVPARVLDTRSANGISGSLSGGSPVSLTLTNRGGIPSSATAVVLTVTAADATTGTYITVYPGDTASPPVVSDLNLGPGQTVANMVVVRLPSSGSIDLLTALGNTDLIADVVGYYS